jgi:hypothetical protein
MDGIRLIYYRIGEKGLNPNDSYSSDPFGTKEKRDEMLGGDGSPIIGISGNIQGNGAVSGLRIITAPIAPKEATKDKDNQTKDKAVRKRRAPAGEKP